MRYISNEQLQEGMVLAQPFYGAKFEILLGGGMALSAHHIQRIRGLGYAGVYIEDALSEGIVVRDVIPSELRMRTVKAAKEILMMAERPEAYHGFEMTRERQAKIIMPVIDAIFASPQRLVERIDLKPFEDYSCYHAANVLVLSLLIGVDLGIAGTQLYELGMAALLHDVGNMFIPKSVLNKSGKLTPEEFELIKAHSQMGFDYLREHFDISIEACMGALQHHENFNGTGYPNKLSRDKISIYGRIIAVTDVYDALTSRRPYRKPVFPPAALDFMEASSGTMFDPDILASLGRVIALYPTGVCVELESGARCIVAENYPATPARPRLRPMGGGTAADLRADSAGVDMEISQIIEL